MTAATIIAEVEEVESQLARAHTMWHTLVYLRGCHPRGKPLLIHKKACKFPEDKKSKNMHYWNHILCSDETKINLFDSGGVQCVTALL